MLLCLAKRVSRKPIGYTETILGSSFWQRHEHDPWWKIQCEGCDLGGGPADGHRTGGQAERVPGKAKNNNFGWPSRCQSACSHLTIRVNCLTWCLSFLCASYTNTPNIISVLVCLIFSQQGLPFPGPLDHLELFAGDMAVSIGEIQAPMSNNKRCVF